MRKTLKPKDYFIRSFKLLPISAALVYAILAYTNDFSFNVRRLPIGDLSRSLVLTAAATQMFTNYTEVDWEKVSEMSQEAISISPLNSKALTLYGLSLEGRGDSAGGRQIISAAARMNTRDNIAHYWMALDRIAIQDWPAAIDQIDILLRVQPQLWPRFYEILLIIASTPSSLDALSEKLSEMPPWRAQFITYLTWQSERGLRVGTSIAARLRSRGSTFTKSEFGLLLTALIDANRPVEGYFLWLSSLSDLQMEQLEYLSNGRFEAGISGLPFDWQISDSSGFIADITNIGEEHALWIQLYRGRPDKWIVRKLLVLPAGTFEMKGDFRANRVKTYPGFAWTISCVGIDSRVIGETSPIEGTVPWSTFSFDFSVPQQNCSAQWLTLTVGEPDSDFEKANGGEAWFNNLSISQRDTPYIQ